MVELFQNIVVDVDNNSCLSFLRNYHLAFSLSEINVLSFHGVRDPMERHNETGYREIGRCGILRALLTPVSNEGKNNQNEKARLSKQFDSPMCEMSGTLLQPKPPGEAQS